MGRDDAPVSGDWEESPAQRHRFGRPPPLPPIRSRTVALTGMAAAAVLAAVVSLPLWIWFFWRIEPPTGQVAVLIRKTGHDLPADQVIALEAGQKGIQLDVLPEGRHWRNPYTWSSLLVEITDIPAGQLGVQVRLYGRDPRPGAIIAVDGEKGILADILRPGKYRINPHAVDVRIVAAVSIRPGSVGVVTSLVGADILGEEAPAGDRNDFLVGAAA
ncbi:MAG: hypothetical protein JXR77_19695, partial [Lentisphaeria bacterium]|nr:hypothetical protein [Lentisphaeria bacterium]